MIQNGPMRAIAETEGIVASAGDVVCIPAGELHRAKSAEPDFVRDLGVHLSPEFGVAIVNHQGTAPRRFGQSVRPSATEMLQAAQSAPFGSRFACAWPRIWFAILKYFNGAQRQVCKKS